MLASTRNDAGEAAAGFLVGQVEGATTKTVMKQAEAGMKLFAAQQEQEGLVELDEEAAKQHREEVEARLAKMEEEVAALSGKDHKKERTAKGKEIAEIRSNPQYIDACRVSKGLRPQHGCFLKAGPSPAKALALAVDAVQASQDAAQAAAVDACLAVEQEKAEEDERRIAAAAEDLRRALEQDEEERLRDEKEQLTPEEKHELQLLEEDIGWRAAGLRGAGLSCTERRKDPLIVRLKMRAARLKAKVAKKRHNGGSTAEAPLSTEDLKEMVRIQDEIEAYRQRLREEYGYSKKDMRDDPDLATMEMQLEAFMKREL